jgi:hypothetical protein
METNHTGSLAVSSLGRGVFIGSRDTDAYFVFRL